jgi:hypothetical protein
MIGWAVAEDPKPAAKKGPPKTPEIVGKWTGDWGAYDPAKGVALDKAKCKVLDCTVVMKESLASAASRSANAAGGKVWEATFEGECGRPYKYTIKMDGRQAADTVLFKGTVDLGEADGGVYDWVGRATDTEFAGFYTSSHHVGVFRLTKVNE